MRSSLLPLLFLLLRITGIDAYYGIDYNAKAAYFNFINGDLSSLYVFALNVVPDTGDVYFHMSGPKLHNWIGVGFGSTMKDSFMLIAYPSADGLNTTISPRIATGHTEPVYDPTVEIHKIYNDTYAPNANTVTENGTGTIISHAVCRNCSRWMTQDGPRSLDVTDKAFNFIFALGPNVTFRSDSPDASLPRHGFAGRFDMNLVAATNDSGWYGRVPAPNVPHFPFPPNDTAFASFASTPAYDTFTLSDPLPGIHGALMLVAFVILFPLGAVVMALLKKVLWHAAIQVVGFILAFAGLGVAIHFSPEYNRSKNFDSAHQIVGFIALAGLLMQLGLGLIHHALFSRSQTPTPFGRIHMVLGPLVIILGLVNGGLGFQLANNHYFIIPYAVVVGVIGFMFITTIGCFLWLRNRRKYKPEEDRPKDMSLHGSEGDSGYEMAGPAAYGEQIPEPYEPPTPYSPSFPEMVPAPYSPTTPYSPGSVPYTPSSAYTPVTPNTWRKEEISRWPVDPFTMHDYKSRWI